MFTPDVFPFIYWGSPYYLCWKALPSIHYSFSKILFFIVTWITLPNHGQFSHICLASIHSLCHSLKPITHTIQSPGAPDHTELREWSRSAELTRLHFCVSVPIPDICAGFSTDINGKSQRVVQKTSKNEDGAIAGDCCRFDTSVNQGLESGPFHTCSTCPATWNCKFHDK